MSRYKLSFRIHIGELSEFIVTMFTPFLQEDEYYKTFEDDLNMIISHVATHQPHIDLLCQFDVMVLTLINLHECAYVVISCRIKQRKNGETWSYKGVFECFESER